jgi:hypothetical protein
MGSTEVLGQPRQKVYEISSQLKARCGGLYLSSQLHGKHK